MMRITAATEPAKFDAGVRQKGLAWLTAKGLATATTLPPKTKLPSYWTVCLDDMMAAYAEVCAYASLRINPITGARSADHFAAKSRTLTLAYEWSNYRLACGLMNARKNVFDDVLDPFLIINGTFELDVLTGGLNIAAHVTGQLRTDAETTINRLQLDGARMRRERLKHIDRYLTGGISAAVLKEDSPFIHDELLRQGHVQAPALPQTP